MPTFNLNHLIALCANLIGKNGFPTIYLIITYRGALCGLRIKGIAMRLLAWHVNADQISLTCMIRVWTICGVKEGGAICHAVRVVILLLQVASPSHVIHPFVTTIMATQPMRFNATVLFVVFRGLRCVLTTSRKSMP